MTHQKLYELYLIDDDLLITIQMIETLQAKMEEDVEYSLRNLIDIVGLSNYQKHQRNFWRAVDETTYFVAEYYYKWDRHLTEVEE